jgi:riboflavin kinase/FMN adenylyltransferase
MKILRHPSDYSGESELALTIGNFDGVHRGHQALLQHLSATAKERQLKTAVLLFEPQPLEYFQGAKAPLRISGFAEKMLLLQKSQIDYVFCLAFHAKLAAQSAEAFIRDTLVRGLHVKYLLVGPDFRFGAKRQGDINLLRIAAKQFNFEFFCHQEVLIGEGRVSSTRIRRCLLENNFIEAEKLLGHPYFISGHVVHGLSLGRKQFVATANIQLRSKQRYPSHGIYCVRAAVHEATRSQTYNAVASIGYRPSVGGTALTLEVHLLDIEADLYGKRIDVAFLHFLREEAYFETHEALAQQIHADVQAAKVWFASNAV